MIVSTIISTVELYQNTICPLGFTNKGLPNWSFNKVVHRALQELISAIEDHPLEEDIFKIFIPIWDRLFWAQQKTQDDTKNNKTLLGFKKLFNEIFKDDNKVHLIKPDSLVLIEHYQMRSVASFLIEKKDKIEVWIPKPSPYKITHRSLFVALEHYFYEMLLVGGLGKNVQLIEYEFKIGNEIYTKQKIPIDIYTPVQLKEIAKQACRSAEYLKCIPRENIFCEICKNPC